MALQTLLPHPAGQNLKRVGETDLLATTNLGAAAVVISLQAAATCLTRTIGTPLRPYLFHLKEDMTLIMNTIRSEMRRGTPAEARTEMRREARTTETMTDAHGTMTTLPSHVSAVTSLLIENQLGDNTHALETPLPNPDMDLLGASHPATVTATVNPLIDPAAPQPMQAMMREIDVEAIAHSLAK